MGSENKVWGIHTMNDAVFTEENVIAIGWENMGDLSVLGDDLEAFKEKYRQSYLGAPKQSVAVSASMLYKFVWEAQVGDYVIYPSKTERMVYFGVIEGEYQYMHGVMYPQRRKARWIKKLPRTAFSQGALYEIGSALTFFTVKNYADEYLDTFLLRKGQDKFIRIEEDESVAATAEDIIQSTRDFILKELSRKLKGYDLEDFVADLFHAMGYRTKLSPHGGDSGIDITAYKDELPPRILVQVKSQDGDIRETTIQSLKGAMREGDYGVFVTLSDYTKNARAYLENTPIIRGINGADLVDLILKYYDKLSEKYKKIIPLKMVYIPVPQDGEEEGE